MILPPLGYATGATRFVVLTTHYAFKFPRLWPYRNFLQGLLANMQEANFWTMQDERFCPVLFSVWGGWLTVMPRARMMTDEEWETFNVDEFCDYPGSMIVVPAEDKQSSFGYLDGRIVAIDYGN